MTEQEYQAMRDSRMAGSAFDLSTPVTINGNVAHSVAAVIPSQWPISRESGTYATSLKDEVFQVLTEFALSCCDPEGLGHVAAPEIIVRAAACKKLVASLRKEPPKCGVGYQEPPPARCEACDSE